MLDRPRQGYPATSLSRLSLPPLYLCALALCQRPSVSYLLPAALGNVDLLAKQAQSPRQLLSFEKDMTQLVYPEKTRDSGHKSI